MNCVWEVLNKVAIIGTILGIPATLYGIYRIIYNTIVVYDRYRELNPAGGYTVAIGNYTRSDKRNGKKENPNREYHKKNTDDTSRNWK